MQHRLAKKNNWPIKWRVTGRLVNRTRGSLFLLVRPVIERGSGRSRLPRRASTGWLSEDLYRGNRERNDLSRSRQREREGGRERKRKREEEKERGNVFASAQRLASFMHKPFRCTSTHVTEQTRYCDDARMRCGEGVQRGYKLVGPPGCRET